ncbi:MAG: hypothetical protein HY720_18710 [Planctomycetes bacterium]|nr:hypothetical protein [Planctomycetota bacterium]
MKESHEEFVKSLSSEDTLLIRLAEDLFDGNWNAMIEDIRDRHAGRPYLFDIGHERLADHLNRIERLRDYETQHRIKLVSLLPGG